MVRGVSRRGAAKVEYALLLTLISVSCILVVHSLGRNVGGLFDGLGIPANEPRDGSGGGGGGKGGNPGEGNNGNDLPVGNAPIR